jgi:hypothetical protein
MGEFYQNDLKQFEIQIMKVIEGYYLHLKNEQISFIQDKTKTKDKIIEYLNEKNNDNLIEKINEKDLYDLPNLLNLCQIFFEDVYKEKIKEKKNIFNFNLSKRISSEIIDFRNHFAHTEKVSSEYILRFYENFYFYLKIVCIPEIKDVYTEYFKKDLNIYIKKALEINIQRTSSFQLSFNMDNNLNNFIEEKPIKTCNLKEKDLEYLYNCLIPSSFPKFKYEENKIEDDSNNIENSINESVSIQNDISNNSTIINNTNEKSLIQNNSILNNSAIQSNNTKDDIISKENNDEDGDIYEEEEELDNKTVEKNCL